MRVGQRASLVCERTPSRMIKHAGVTMLVLIPGLIALAAIQCFMIYSEQSFVYYFFWFAFQFHCLKWIIFLILLKITQCKYHCKAL